jgi:NAD(P)H-dependent flavin oxidoreductase YrpB (nitropropane dioxygenase family)
MKLKPLKIGDLIAKVPIIQGGMGVGVSLSNLASAVASCGGIGIISAAQIGFKEPDFEKSPLEANLRALKNHIITALSKAKDGIIGVNIMCAANNYDELVKTSIEAGAQIIISGAGLPTHLPELCKDSDVKMAPIISSDKAANVIMKVWDRNYKVAPDALVYEGPQAGGHLGFKLAELTNEAYSVEDELVKILKTIKIYEEKYNKSIPLIAAGGIFTGSDIAKMLELGVSGVQMATRFVATEECDAHINFKMAYVNSTIEDISIVKSPVGMPGRAILNPFVEKTKEGNIKVTKCYKCITKCNPATTPYCITKALINAVEGDLDNALIFCGSNAHRVDKIVTVRELMDELISEAENYA